MNQKQYRQFKTIVPGAEVGVKVVRSKNPKVDIERALKSWKRQLKQTGILQLVKDRREYVKPTTKRRIAKATRLFNARQHTEANR